MCYMLEDMETKQTTITNIDLFIYYQISILTYITILFILISNYNTEQQRVILKCTCNRILMHSFVLVEL